MANLKEIIQNSFANFYKALSKNVVNNLNSTSTTLPLAANQGKVLKEQMEKLIPIGYVFTWNNVNVQQLSGSASVKQLENVPDLTTAQNVHDYFGFGTWQRVSSVFLYGGNPTYGGGNSSVTLGVSNLPSHTHGIPSLSGSTGVDNHSHQVQIKVIKDIANSKTAQYARPSAANEALLSGWAGNTDSYSHSHTVTTNSNTSDPTGSAVPFSIMPPYVGVYIWQRIA